MRAIVLAAGIGCRMNGGDVQPPKCMIEFDGRSLIERHLEILTACGVTEIVVGVGYQAKTLIDAVARLARPGTVHTVLNPDYREGNIVTLWPLRDWLIGGGDVLLMDADVLYDVRIMRRLVESPHAGAFLLDRNFDVGDEPVKLCVRDGRLVEFGKRIPTGASYDVHGESVGFFKLNAALARHLEGIVGSYIERGQREAFYEDALRNLIFSECNPQLGHVDVIGLPWIEIDFPQDVVRASNEILPRLRRFDAVDQVAMTDTRSSDGLF